MPKKIVRHRSIMVLTFKTILKYPVKNIEGIVTYLLTRTKLYDTDLVVDNPYFFTILNNCFFKLRNGKKKCLPWKV